MAGSTSFGYPRRVRYLGIDFGERRIGLATADSEGFLATPRRTLVRKSDEDAIRAIGTFAREEEIGILVIGLPHHADGAENDAAPRVRSFGRKLGDGLNLPVRFVNEHLTSVEANRRDPAGAGLDAASAAVILEDFLSGEPR